MSADPSSGCSDLSEYQYRPLKLQHWSGHEDDSMQARPSEKRGQRRSAKKLRLFGEGRPIATARATTL